MSNRIRFHLDEQVKSVIARELRRRGIDLTTTVEVGLRTQNLLIEYQRDVWCVTSRANAPYKIGDRTRYAVG